MWDKPLMEILMVDPSHYDIKYAINPYMMTPDGKLQTVDKAKALKQWNDLKSTFECLGAKVSILHSDPETPDMVYAANNALLFKNPKSGRATALMAQMKSENRRAELPIFESWYRDHGFDIAHLKSKHLSFEGPGDALFHPSKKVLFGGYGPRTDKEVYQEIKDLTGFEVILLGLQDKDFYHLDTCFSILSSETVAIQESAFTADALAHISRHFKNVIRVTRDENLKFFACNCFSWDGQNVILQKGPHDFIQKLKGLGFTPHEVETGEFMKGGGSVFCLKMALP